MTFQSADKVAPDAPLLDSHYLGTGFFLRLSSGAAFVTARHVIEAADLKPHQRLGFGSLDDSRHHWPDYIQFHATADLAFARFSAPNVPAFVEPLEAFAEEPLLPTGTVISSFGFPFTSKTPLPDGKISLDVEETYFAGYIASTFTAKRLTETVARPFANNYGLSFEVPRGLSGAPLLLSHMGGYPRVCGLVYYNRSTHFRVDQYETSVTSEGPVIEREVVQMHHLGLASSVEELVSIPGVEYGP